MNEKIMTAGETAIQRFEYQGNSITFDTGDGIMVNATEMARSFGKRVNDWLRLAATREFLKALAECRGEGEAGIPASAENQHVTDGDVEPLQAHHTDFVIVKKGGSGKQGTWFHEDVAMEFARWLSPKFAIWTNDRIKELLTRGHTETGGFRLEPTAETVENFGKFAEKMHDRLIGIWREIAKLQMAQEAQAEATLKIAESIRKGLPAQPDTTPDEVQDEGPDFPRTGKNPCSDDGNYTLSDTARMLGFSDGIDFVNWARERRILGCDGISEFSRWYPRAPYTRRGFFDFRTSTRPGNAENYLVVTPKGVDMLRWELFGNSPM